MAKIITAEYINETKFYQIPKSFFHNPLYKDMKNESKIAYAILRDLLELSIKNNWINQDNEVFVKLSRDKLMKHLNIKGTAKYTEVMKELIEKELIVKRRVGLNRIDETYICIPEELSVVYSDEELLNYEEDTEKESSNLEDTRMFENQTSKGLKNEPPKVSKSNLLKFENQTHTNTNYTNTNLTKTNYTNSSSSIEASYLINLFEEGICKLTKNNLKNFESYLEKYNSDFIESIIKYGEETSAKSFRWFTTVIKACDRKGINSKEEFFKDVESFRGGIEKKPSPKSKPKTKVEPMENKIENINDYILDDMISDSETEVVVVDGTPIDIETMKENILNFGISNISYNAWFSNLDYLEFEDKVLILCPNDFTITVLEDKFFLQIRDSLKSLGIEKRIIFSVKTF